MILVTTADNKYRTVMTQMSLLSTLFHSLMAIFGDLFMKVHAEEGLKISVLVLCRLMMSTRLMMMQCIYKS